MPKWSTLSLALSLCLSLPPSLYLSLSLSLTHTLSLYLSPSPQGPNLGELSGGLGDAKVVKRLREVERAEDARHHLLVVLLRARAGNRLKYLGRKQLQVSGNSLEYTGNSFTHTVVLLLHTAQVRDRIRRNPPMCLRYRLS